MEKYLISAIVLFYFVSIAQSGDVVARYGSAVSIPSNYSASQALVFSVNWKHDGVDVVTFGAGVAHFQGSYVGRATFDDVTFALALDGLSFDDQGVYECSITSSNGSFTSQTNLRVLASPNVEAEAFEFLDDGSNKAATLAQCTATQASKPFTMKWVTDMGDEVVPDTFRVESENPTFANLVDANLPLTIRPDPERNNGRKFTCLVEDALGNQLSADAVLDVSVPTTTPRTTTPQASPNFVMFPTSDDAAEVTVMIGTAEQFECKIAGVPTPTVSWYRGSEKIVSDIGQAIVTVAVDSLSDAATYECKGTNNAGQIARKFTIDVQGPPKVMIPNGLENENETSLVDPKMANFELSCEVEANPKPAIRWSVEGLNGTDFVVVEERQGNSVKSIINITSSGIGKKPAIAECFASNVHGDAGRSFYLEYPIAEANTALVVGVVMAVIVLLALVFFIVFFSLTRRQHKDVDVTKPDEAESGCVVCTPSCFGRSPPKDEIKEEAEGDQVKEIQEEGTSEEKLKLTEAEEKPAAENDPKIEGGNDEAAEDVGGAAEAKKPKRKMHIPLPTQCCRGNKQELKEESCDGEDEEEQTEKNAQNPEQNSGDRTEQTTDKDSGKGDTLEKLADEKNATK